MSVSPSSSAEGDTIQEVILHIAGMLYPVTLYVRKFTINRRESKEVTSYTWKDAPYSRIPKLKQVPAVAEVKVILIREIPVQEVLEQYS